jgi:putative addiction module antidote
MNKPSSVSAGHALKLIKIGNSTGVVLPKELLARLGVEQGDSLTLTSTDDGMVLKPHDPKFAEQIEAARDVMRRRRKALRELAK